MRINNILHSFNKYLEQERESNNIQKNLGHFIFYQDVEKCIGDIKKITSNFVYHSTRVNKTFPICKKVSTLSCRFEHLEEVKEKCAEEALTDFISLMFSEAMYSKDKFFNTFINGNIEKWK